MACTCGKGDFVAPEAHDLRCEEHLNNRLPRAVPPPPDDRERTQEIPRAERVSFGKAAVRVPDKYELMAMGFLSYLAYEPDRSIAIDVLAKLLKERDY